MAERDVRIVIRADTDEATGKVKGLSAELGGVGAAAQAGVTPAGAAIDGVGAAAGRAAPEVEKIPEAIKKIPAATAPATAAEKDLAAAVEKVAAATKKLESTGDSAGALMKGAVRSKVAMEELAAAEEKARVAGAKIGPDVSAALDKANSATDKAIAKAAALRDAQEKVASSTASAKNKTQELAGSMTSLDGIFGKLEQSNNKASKAIGNVGFAALGAVAGITMAVQAGKQLGEAIDWMSNKWQEHATKTQNAALEHQKLEYAMKLVEKGVLQQRATVAELIADYDAFVKKTRLAAGQQGELAEALLKTRKPIEDVAKSAAMMNAEFEGAFKGSQKHVIEMAKANEVALREIEARYRELGAAVPESLRKALRLLDDLKAGEKAAAEEIARTAQRHKEAEAAFATVGKSIADVAKAFREGKISYEEATRQIQQLSKESGMTTGGLRFLAQEIKNTDEAARLATTAADKLAGGIHDVLTAAQPSAEAIAATTRALVEQAEAAERSASALRDAKQAAEDLGAAQQQAADMMKSANVGGQMEQLAGGVSTAAKGMTATMTLMNTVIRHGFEETIKEIKNTSEAIKELGESNKGLADRAADDIALLTDAWRSGMQSQLEWLRTWQETYDQFQRLIALNPGTKIAKDFGKIIKALDELKDRVMSGKEKQAEKVAL